MRRILSLLILVLFSLSVLLMPFSAYAQETDDTDSDAAVETDQADTESESADSEEDQDTSSSDSSEDTNPNQDQINDWERRKQDAERKLEETLDQQNSLSSQIDYMDTQMYLTELQIEETEARIAKTEQEMETLDGRIDGLDTSLDDLSETLINHIATNYKQRNVSLFELFFDAQSANSLLDELKYQQTARNNNQRLLFQVQTAKANFQDQKEIREKKRAELASLQETLAVQKAELDNQRSQKEQLLSVTQNDEATYRNLIAEAERQIASFQNFVQSTGVGQIAAGSLGGGDGGWYLSQRDSRWAGNSMGSSSMSVLDVGCFITSIAMVFRSYGYDMTPVTMSANPSFFLPGSAYMYIPSRFNGSWPGGKAYKNIGAGQIESYLSRGVPVIAGVNGASHYIVLKRSEGGEYVMNDPIYGPDLKVSEYYGLSGPFGVFE